MHTLVALLWPPLAHAGAPCAWSSPALSGVWFTLDSPAEGERALSPRADLDLGGGLQVTPSGGLELLGLEGECLRVTATVDGYQPVTPVSALITCTDLDLTRAPAPAPDGRPWRLVRTGDHPLVAAPGGEVLGWLRCPTSAACPLALVGETRGPLVEVALVDRGVRLTGWLPSDALDEGAVGVGGMMGGSPATPTATRICDGQTVYLRSPAGRLSPLGQLQPGATTQIGTGEGPFLPIWLPAVHWLSPYPNTLVGAADALIQCK